MDFISITDILENTISEIKHQLPVDENDFIKLLQEFQEITKLKLDNDIAPKEDLTQKLDVADQKLNQLCKRLQELQEHFTKQLTFQDELIEQNNALIRERKKQHEDLLASERAIYKQQITSTKRAFEIREQQKYKSRIEQTKYQLNENRMVHVAAERLQRQKWIQKKENLNEILAEYDEKMMKQQDKLENVTSFYENEKSELQFYKILCENQDKPYHDIMQEKEEYIESVRQQKLYEIKVKLAKRTIVRFVERYYPIWKKKKMKATKKKNKYKHRR